MPSARRAPRLRAPCPLAPSLLALLCVAASLGGCIAPSPPAADLGVEPPAVEAQPWSRAEWHAFVGDLYRALCARWSTCSGRAERCRLDRANDLFDRNLRALGEAVLQGRVAIDPTAAAACLAAVRDGEECAPPWFEGPACARAFIGLQPDGAPCIVSDACGPASYCRLDAECGGQCAPRAGEGDPCDADAGCADGLYCAASTCAPRGAPCAEDACRAADRPPPAGPGARCSDDTRPIAIGFPRDGLFQPARAACAGDHACEPTSDGLRCVPAGGIGDPCAADSDPWCAPALTCDPESVLCAPRLEPGAVCGDATPCPRDMQCVDGRCLPPTPAGLDCRDDGDCAHGDCVDGACAPRETRCGRAWTPPPECAVAAECPPRLGAEPICPWGGRCAYLPRGQRWHLTAPRHDGLPALAQLFGGWPESNGWLLHLHGERQWLAPADADGRPHPRLPAIGLSGSVAFDDARLTTGGFHGLGRLLRPTADPCAWRGVSTDFSVDFLWTRWPDAPLHVSTALRVRHGSGITLDGVPLDALMRAHDMPSDAAGEHWWIRIEWQAAPAALVGEPVFAAPEPIDVCAER